MSRFPCSRCGQRVLGRVASLYWAWFNADGARTAWKQRLCVACVKSTLRELLSHAQDSTPDVCSCPACGSESTPDLDPIYLNLYLPRTDGQEFALTTCGPCAAKLRLIAQDGAEKLPDRSGTSGGGFNRDDKPDEWAEVLA